MRRFVFFAVFAALTSAATAQEYRLNVPRPAYDYELVEAGTAEKLDAGDREKLAGFLAERQAAAVRARTAPCPEFLSGKTSLAEFAASLDHAIEEMHIEIAAAYQRMEDRLSSPGRSELQRTLADKSAWSAQTRAVDIVAAAPRAAQASFTDLCKGVVSNRPRPAPPAPVGFSSRN